MQYRDLKFSEERFKSKKRTPRAKGKKGSFGGEGKGSRKMKILSRHLEA